MLKISVDYSAHVKLINVYIKESHATDGWYMGDVDGEELKQPKTLQERMDVAQRFLSKYSGSHSPTLVLDGMDNIMEQEYEAGPERIYVISQPQQGRRRILWRSGIGPFFYFPKELRTWLRGKCKPAEDDEYDFQSLM